MRFCVGGCVLNRFIRDLPENGCMMNMCAVPGDASMGMRFE